MAQAEWPRGMHMLSAGCVVAAAAMVLIGDIAYGGDVYKWVDENGVVHFSDRLPPSGHDRYKVTTQKDGGGGAGASPAKTDAAALYSAESYERMVKASQEMGHPGAPPGISARERYRIIIERARAVYRRAGLDYDGMIRAVADELRNGRVEFPLTTPNVLASIYLGVNGYRELGQLDGVDCLQFFHGETAEAVKYLWENSIERAKERRGGRSGGKGPEGGRRNPVSVPPANRPGPPPSSLRDPGERAGLASREGSTPRRGGNGRPAPFTVESGERIMRSLNVQLGKARGEAARSGPKNGTPSPASGGRDFIDIHRAAYEEAGFDFDATIRAVANDFRRSAMPANELLNTRLETPFFHVVLTLGRLATGETIDRPGDFDPETGRAVEFIRATLATMEGLEDLGNGGSGSAAGNRGPSTATRDSVEAELRGVWKGATDALKADNIETALLHFASTSRGDYRRRLSRLRAENGLDVLWKDVKGLRLHKYDGAARYVEAGIVRVESRGEFSYPITFVRELGAWKIYGF